MSTITTPPPAMRATAKPYYRITVDQYDRMLETGILRDGDPVELIDGMLVPKMPKTPEHGYPIKTLSMLIPPILASGWTWIAQDPIRLPEYDEPEPDFAVLAGNVKDYAHRHPAPGEIAIVVEVAVSSLKTDRGKKRAAYALADIPIYWIVNLKDRQIEVCSRPSGRRYRSIKVYKPGQLLPVVINGNQIGDIAVDDILPELQGE